MNVRAKRWSWFGLMFLSASAWAGSEFRPGEVWLDTGGKPIQAHSGGILVGGTYAGNPIVGQTQALADQAFFTCLVRGYAPAGICYLSAFNDWRTRDSNLTDRPTPMHRPPRRRFGRPLTRGRPIQDGCLSTSLTTVPTKDRQANGRFVSTPPNASRPPLWIRTWMDCSREPTAT